MWPHLPFVLLLGAAIAFLMALSLLNHQALGTGYDLGIYDQTIWNLSQGRIWHTSLVYETAGFYDHFEPILAAIVPLYLFQPDVRWLLILQATALGLGALPIYLYAVRRFSAVTRFNILIALGIAAAYLAYPALHHANLNDFHEVALLPPLLGFALYGLLTGRRRMTFTFIVLGLLVKEDFAVTALAFGLYIALLNPNGFQRRDGLLLAMGAVVWALLVLYLFYPALTRGLPYPFVGRRYAWLGDSPESALQVLLTQPWVVLPYLLEGPKLQFLQRLFAPLLFIPVLGWPVIGLALPILGYLMLSSYEPQWSVQSYYNPPLLPILFFATIYFFDRLQGVLTRLSPSLVLGGLTLALLLSVGLAYRAGAPGPGGLLYDPQRFQRSAEDEEAYRLMSQIPDEAAVATIWRIIPHLSQRQQIDVVLDRPENPPDYLLLENNPQAQSAPIYPHAAPPGWPPIFHDYVELEATSAYRLLRWQRGVPLVPIVEPEPPPMPLSVAAFGWPSSLDPSMAPVVVAGDSVPMLVGWRRTGPIDRRYVLFTHLLDESGTLIAQNDHEPVSGRFPTTEWESWTVPTVVIDEQRLLIPPETAPGSYQLWVGAYDRETFERIAVGGGEETLLLLGDLTVVTTDAP